jgi:molybdopterin molybdotransferase
VIHPDEALTIIDAIETRLPTEIVALDRALGRVPAADPVSRVDQPPFDKSTMDGFAYASADGELARAGDEFRIVRSIAAGGAPGARLGLGECARIMTGAPIPQGAAAVHRLELARAVGDRASIAAPEAEPNIARAASNRPAGEAIFQRRELRPQDIGILAANGIAEIEVVRRPVVRVLSTGDELAAADGAALGEWRIYDSNGPQLVAQAAAAGCEASFGGIVPDDEAALRAAIDEASRTADLIIVSGGVSAGDFDYVPAAARLAGFDLLFHGIAMKPGKPAFLARRGDRFLYGAPGNPLAAFVGFEVMIRPLLARLAGLLFRPAAARVRLGGAISGRDAERVEFLPVKLRDGLAFPLRCSNSTMLDALAEADALVRLEIGRARAEIGEELDARLV